ncbi:MAG: RHS repeat-associated core domain-containing protein [Acidobacteriota bacterium]
MPALGYGFSAASALAMQIAKDTIAPVPVAIAWVKRVFRRSAVPQRRETTADRTSGVSRISITPAKIVGYIGEQITFSAVGANSAGLTIQGVQFSWASSDADKLRIDNSGTATLGRSGLVWLSARTPNASARVPVLIRPSERPVQTDLEWQIDQEQLRPDTVITTPGSPSGSVLDSIVDRLVPTAHAQSGGGDSADFPYDELWSEPRNLVGSPRNRLSTSSAIGGVLPEGSNFELSVPLYGLQGRGVSESVALHYNSCIWSRHGSAVTFNAVNSWPYLGFNLTPGRIVTYPDGSNTKLVLIDSDGTRHYLGSGPGGTSTTYQTNDGSHITFTGKATNGGIIYYNNGVQKTVQMINNRLQVTRVLNPNGNYITIAYKSQSAPTCGTGGAYVWKQAIDTITDTLGRVIQFNYDTCNNLVSIDVPGYGGTAGTPVTTTIARFDYLVTSSVSTSFSGLTVENVPSGNSVVQLSHVYMPATNTGYKFTYSAYGMISTVSLRKDMTYTSGTGVISDGNEKAYVSFNYPATGSSLTDAPSFSQWTQYPAATSGGTATTSFTANGGLTTKSFTVTSPDASTVTLTRSNVTGTDFGLLTQLELKTGGGTSMSKSVISYSTDGGGQPQVANVVAYDDATPTANQTKEDYDYDSYGNVTNTREYGFKQSGSWVVRRRTRNVYKTDTSYVNAYLRNLVVENDLYDAQLDTNDANDVLVAKTTYTYDDYAAMGGMENYGGTTYSVGHLSNYDTSWTVRGNSTGSTEYTDLTAPSTITHLRKIDIFGNVVKEQLSCCSEQTMNTDDTNGFLVPVTIVRGDPPGTTLTTTYGSDFNTSLQMSVMDPNSQTTTISARDAALRPTQTDLPTGVTMTASYNESTLSVSASATYDDGGTTKTLVKTTTADGWGRQIQTVDQYGSQVNRSYDNMGYAVSVTNPFTAGGTPSYSTATSYDVLGRATTVTLPDSQTVQTSYNGNVVTVTDQVNRKLQQVKDGLGQLVTVNEQDGTGALTLSTTNTYDAVGNRTEMNQGNQLRSYKYDARSRLLYERIPEQTASINDGSGTFWTCKYTYTDFNAVATRTDARGVVGTNSYDTLNRLTQVSYNTVSGVTTALTVTFTYDADSTYGTTANGKLVRVNVGSDYQERYTFDSNYRVASSVFNIGTRTYTTDNQYNEVGQPKQMRHMYYDYDSTGRLSAIKDSAGSARFYNPTYNEAGQLTGDTLFTSGLNAGALVSSVTVETFGHDPSRLQLTSQTATTTNTQGACFPSCPLPPPPGGTNLSLTYSYQASSGQMGAGSTAGNADQLMSVSGTIGGVTESASYTYDNDARLVTSNQTSNGTSAQRRFAHDRWGNRTGVWNATSGGTQIQAITLQQTGGVPTNRITSVTDPSTTLNYTYDAAGNVTSDGVHSYTYDSASRLAGMDGTAATYGYDQQNRRYKKKVGTAVTHYIWQGGKVLAEYNGSTGAVLASYWYVGERLFRKGSGTIQMFLSDRLSVRLALSEIGAVVGRQGHLPFGEDFAESGTQQKQHLTGYERDAESGTDYAVNRQYGPAVARFMQTDPSGRGCSSNSPQNANPYSYVGNDSVNRTDPLGLNWILIGCTTYPDPGGRSCTSCAQYDDETGNVRARVTCDGPPLAQIDPGPVIGYTKPDRQTGDPDGAGCGPCCAKTWDNCFASYKKRLKEIGGWAGGIKIALKCAGLCLATIDNPIRYSICVNICLVEQNAEAHEKIAETVTKFIECVQFGVAKCNKAYNDRCSCFF